MEQSSYLSFPAPQAFFFFLDQTGKFGGLSRWCQCKESACQCRRRGFDPWIGKFPGEGNSNPLQNSCLENPMDRGAWWATAHGVAQNQTRLSNFTFTFHFQCHQVVLKTLPWAGRWGLNPHFGKISELKGSCGDGSLIIKWNDLEILVFTYESLSAKGSAVQFGS